MGFFNKLFKQENNPVGTGEKLSKIDLEPCKTEQELIQRFGGIALDKQSDLSEVIGSNNWNVDMTKGEISFGTNLVFPIQVLGTFSHSSETWLWAWANTESGLPESIIQQALQLKKYGEENEIPLLSNSEFDASKDDLHLIGLIASGMFNSSAYYVADYGQGAMVVTIKSDTIDKIRKEDHHRVLTTFPQLISLFEMNHQVALTNYLNAKGYHVAENGNHLSAERDGNRIVAEFDEQFRLTKLNG
ncbi:DUF6882 domain-containing protein [Pedobacter nutrimenti]|uniref:DUF6882 domain-containing protein n=1 Tax=Pedobacter nutrimenti TaxID=1241337 RepID=UPI00292DD0EF|nr:DUF6882 domain-containing protein [Pedobacter nutrimenti]